MQAYSIPPVLTLSSALPSHPPKVMRDVPQGRVRRLRYSWFTLGMLAGCLLSYGVMRLGQSAQEAPEPEAAIPMADATESQNTQETAWIPVPTAKPTPPKEVLPSIAYPLKVEFSITRGDTLHDLITQYHVSDADAQAVIDAMRPYYKASALRVGREISLELDKDPEGELPYVQRMDVQANALDTVVVKRKGERYVAQKITAQLKKTVAHAGGKIRGSLYASASRAGMPDALMGQLIKSLSYDVDFQRDIHAGDRFDALYEAHTTPSGTVVKTGKLLYAALHLSGKPIELYAYTDKNGDTQYYNSKGESLRKALLKTPINGAQVTSGFGMRMHPMLGFNKMHKGLDFGASTGTPIYAAGNGVVREAGPKGAYGNYVRIQHTASYATAYAHMSRFAKGMKAGAKIKQGQVIGYVGSTGRSTGAHLHYEVLVMGQQVNPSKVTFKTGNQLAGRELANFKRFRSNLQQQLAAATGKRGSQLAANF